MLARRGDELVVIEVRGALKGYRPSRSLSRAKRTRVLRLARRVGATRVEFLEVLGDPGTNPLTAWLLRWRPEWLGLRLNCYELTSFS